MTTFTGSDGDDLITPGAVSPDVTSDGAPTPDAINGDEIDAGAGNDTIDGGGAVGDRDIVDGESGNDLILSADGTLAFGGEGDDSLIGASNDVLFGDEGNDSIVAGDSTRAFGGDGDDLFTAPAGVNGAELHGDAGNDTFLAGDGNIEIHGDDGDDLTVWTMTDAETSNSLIDGGDGHDTFRVVLVQDDRAATVELSNDGAGSDDVHITRDDDPGNWIPTNTDLFVQNTEHIEIVSGRGADNIVVQDQTGLGVETIDIDLGASATGGADGQRDVAALEGAGDADHASVTTVNGGIVVAGLGGVTTTVTDIDHSGAVTDQVRVDTGAGDDSFDLSLGADRAQLAALTVDGGDGADTLSLAGSATGEAYVLTQVDGAALVTVGGAQVVQLENVETLNIATAGGGDSVVIHDLEGSGVQQVNVDLAGAVAGQADGVHDRVTFEDANASDEIFVFQSDDGRSVTAGSGTTQIQVSDLDNQDQVIFHGNDGDDTIVADGAASAAQITLNGNGGDDLVIGGKGAENLFGEAGDDTLIGGAGRNVLNGGDGNDVIVNGDGSIGQGGAGDDTIEASVNDVVQAGDGDDRIVLGLSTQATGEAGNDTFIANGTAANGSTSDGGDGDDSFFGSGGNLVFHGGAGDDTMVWTMGADVSANSELEGGSGHDTVTITGPADAVSDTVTIGDNGTGFELVQLVHTGQTAKLFMQNAETINVSTGSGADSVTVADQTGLGVGALNLATGAGDDRIDLTAAGNAAAITVDTGAGDDTVIGGAGDAVFVFHADQSSDVVRGFHTGDVVDLRGFDASFDALVADGRIVQSGDDVVITEGLGTSVTLAGVDIHALSASDFLFG